MGLAVIYLLSPMNEVTAPSTVRAGSTSLHFFAKWHDLYEYERKSAARELGQT